MARKVADLLWEMLAKAGVKRCYGIVGDALNPVIDGLRRNGAIEFIHVRHEEYGVFAAVADAYLSGAPVVVCGTAGPGVTHLFNGLMDARKEGAAIIALAGDVETRIMDTYALEELNPYKFFDTACLYVGRIVNPEQARAVVTTAIMTAVVDRGPTVISIPGDVASANAPGDSSSGICHSRSGCISAPPTRISDSLAAMIDGAKKVAIFGGDGCRDARDEVLQLAAKLKAPVGYSFRGKQWLEHDNPQAVGMTGLLGYGGAYKAIHDADLLLLLGTDLSFFGISPGDGDVKKVQIDRNPKHIGRRTAVDLGLVGDIRATVAALLPKIHDKQDNGFLEKHSRRDQVIPGALCCTIGVGKGSQESSRSARNSWPPTLSRTGASDNCRCFSQIRARPASGWRVISRADRTAGSLVLFHGPQWPMRLPTPSARNWHSPAARLSHCAVMAASRCSPWATC